jgi:transcription initiation factor TFIIIB Brf1 subunit/transcription initiation factor TFIIB
MANFLAGIYSQIGSRATVGPKSDHLPNPSKSKNPAIDDDDSFCSAFERDDDNECKNYRAAVSNWNQTDKKTPRKKKIPVCESCHKVMYLMSKAQTTVGQSYVCDECGRLEEDIGETVSSIEGDAVGNSDYNTSSNSAAPVRITGPGSYAFQKKLISSTSNYKKQQKQNTVKQIENILYQYEGLKPLPNIVYEAACFYYQIQQHQIIRGSVRVGTMAACLYRKCIENGITRKPKEIADMFRIQQSDLSNGEKILDDLFSRGLLGRVATEIEDESVRNISCSINQFYYEGGDQIDSFLNRYFETLMIAPQYLNFAKSLVRFTIKYRIADACINSSKCAGATYILSICLPSLGIERAQIEKACSISKGTFSRFSNAVFAKLTSKGPTLRKVRSRLRRIFKKNMIPLLHTQGRAIFARGE